MSPKKFSTLIELLRWRAQYQTDQKGYTFLTDGEQESASLTYGELDRHARAIGALLESYSVKGERVLLLYPPGLEFIAAFFGCLYAGAVAVPAYPPRNKRHLPRIQTIVEDAQAKFLLTIEKTQSRIQKWLDQTSSLASFQMLVTDTLPKGIEEHCQEPERHRQDLAFLQYTSGSTAAPRGVMVSHENLLHNLALIQQYFKQTPESRGVIWLPPYHDMGLIGGILQPLFAGFPVVLMAPEAFLQRPFRWLQAISRYQATTSGGPNFAYDLCVTKISLEQRETLDLSSWDLAFNGAEPIHLETLEQFATAFEPCGFRKEALYPCYGLAEATLFVTGGEKSALPVIRNFHAKEMETDRVTELPEGDETGEKVQKLVGCGQNLRDQTIVIVDPESLTQCSPEQIGEIWISGASVTQGYWNRPDINQETFQAYLADTGGGPFLRTGDLGFIKNGELFITGRLKDLIIIRGRNHYPQDIEWTVEQSHPAIRRNCCAAFSVNGTGEERLVVVAEVERRYRERRRRSNPNTYSGGERRRLSDRRQAEVVDTGFNEKIYRPLKTEEAITHIQQAIAEHHGLQVHTILLLKYGTIPRTSSGKIQRHACKARFFDDSLDIMTKWHIDKDKLSALTPPESQEPFTGMWETFVAKLWGATLQVDWTTLTADSHFFQMGGDSLHAATVTGTLSNTLRTEFEADLLYQYPTVKALGSYLKQNYRSIPTTNIEESLVSHYKQYCRPESIEFPLLPLQKLIFDLQASSGVSGYMFLDIEFRGDLDVTLFQEAFRRLLDRHPALRLAFKAHADGRIQYILPPSESKTTLHYKDLSQFTLPQAQTHLEAETDSLLHHFFDNRAGDTFQATLCKMTPETYHLLINFDHLVLDGFSLKKFFEDFQDIYGSLLRRKFVEPMPQTTLTFKEYVEIHTALQDSEQRERDSEYWLQKIPASLPFHRFPNTDDFDEITGFGVYTHTLDLTLIEQLQAHARTYDLTLFSILMASFFKLLANWTGSNLINIYTLYLNRHPYAPDVHDILGCFADALPVWVDNALDGDLLTLAHNIHQDLTEIHRHNSLSIIDIEELIVKKQQVSLDDMDLVTFSFLPFPSAEPDAETPYRISSIRAQSSDAATFLELLVYEACGEFVCSWNFARNHFSPERIAALAAQYENILQDFANYPHLTYWKKQLEDLPVLQLPTDHFRSPAQSRQRNTQNVQISQSLCDKLYKFSQHQKVTLFTTLLTAFQVLLHRYTNQDDIVTGTFLVPQENDETENQKQPDGNPVPIRTDLSDNPTFRKLLERVRQVCLEAQIHRDFPLDRLLGEIRPERKADNVPVFQVIFALQDDLMRDSMFQQDPSINILNSGSVTNDSDLFLSLEKKEQELIGSWHYNPGLFEPATIERMTGHFQTLLEGIVANPEYRISDISILTKAERHQILVEWNDTKTDYPKNTCIHELFEAQVEQTPDAVAVVFENKQMTYQELNTKANQLAHYLQALGIGPEMLIGICVERSLEMVIGLLGILKAGGVYVPLDPDYPQERLTFMIEDTQIPVLLTQQGLAQRLPSGRAKRVCLDSEWETIVLQSKENPLCSVKADNLAYVMYTSGSTGTPKGTSIPHRGVVRLVKETDYADLNSKEVFLQLAPISFDASTLEIWGSLLNGARLVIMPPSPPSLEELGQVIQKHHVTTLWLTAGLFHVMVEQRLEDLRPLRQLLAGGDVLSVPHVRKVLQHLDKCRLINGYGPTENTTFTCCFTIKDIEHISPSVPIGRPIANTQVYILDPYRQPVPIGIPGELYIGGDGLARNYFNRLELTNEKFVPNPFDNEPGARLYKTGDLVRYLPDGNIEFLGRIDHQIKIRGFRIEPGEIEAALAKHIAIKESMVMAREDSPGNKCLVAYVVLKQGQVLSTSELRDFLKKNLPYYMIPSTFVMLEALPLSPNGKVDRRALPAPDGSVSRFNENYVAPRTPIEETLTAIWSDILGVRQVGAYDSFFELGGHSLLAIQIICRVRETFGIKVSLPALFETTNIAGLAEIIVAKQLEKVDSNLLAQVLAETEKLSEDEVARQLFAKKK